MANWAGHAVTLALWLAITPLILHRLGAHDYALWAISTTLLAYAPLLDFGVGSALIKAVAERRGRGESEEAGAVIATGLRLFTGLGVLAFALSVPLALAAPSVFEVAPARRDVLVLVVLLTGAGLGVQLIVNTLNAVLQGIGRYDLLNAVGAAATATHGAVLVAVVLSGGGVAAMCAVYLPLALAWQVPVLLLIRRAAPDLRVGWRGARRDLARDIAGLSGHIFVVNASTIVARRSGELIIATGLPVAAVTPFALARRIADVTVLITYQFSRVLLPIAADFDGRREDGRLRELLLASTRVALAMGVVISGLLVLLGRDLVVAWVGPDQAGAAALLTILAAAAIVDAALGPSIAILQASGRHRPIALQALVAAATSVGLSLALLGPLDARGVALGAAIASALQALVVLPLSLRACGVGARRTVVDALLPALVPAAPMVATVLALMHALPSPGLFEVGAVAAAGTLVYAAAYLAFRAARDERELAGAVVHRIAALLMPRVSRRRRAT